MQDRWKSWFPGELERREAARYARMSWARFQNLPGTRQVADQLGIDDCKCDVIAHYRMTLRFESVMMDLREKYPEKKHGT